MPVMGMEAPGIDSRPGWRMLHCFMTTPAQPNMLLSDVEITGSIRFQGELFLDGRVKGEIASPGTLTLGQHADVQGQIATRAIIIHGNAHAKITVADRCELKTGAHLVGDLKAARLVMEEGATFVGKSEVAPAPAPGT